MLPLLTKVNVGLSAAHAPQPQRSNFVARWSGRARIPPHDGVLKASDGISTCIAYSWNVIIVQSVLEQEWYRVVKYEYDRSSYVCSCASLWYVRIFTTSDPFFQAVRC